MCRYQAEKCTANSGDSYYDKCIKLPQMKSVVCIDTVMMMDECVRLFSFPFVAEGQAQKGFPAQTEYAFSLTSLPLLIFFHISHLFLSRLATLESLQVCTHFQ